MTFDPLTLFGIFAASAMLLCYFLEPRGRIYILLFAFSCVLGSIYGFLQKAWPFGVLEALWALIALQRWHTRRPN